VTNNGVDKSFQQGGGRSDTKAQEAQTAFGTFSINSSVLFSEMIFLSMALTRRPSATASFFEGFSPPACGNHDAAQRPDTRADRIIEQYQDTPPPTQPQTEETIDRIRQVHIRSAQLTYLVARLDFRERINNLVSKRRPSALALLSVLFIVIASWLIWATGWLPPRETNRRLADQTAMINLPPNKADPPLQQRQTSKTEETVDGIRRVQIRLAQLGYLVAKPDGLWGAKSRAALKSFRKRTAS
jgi:hypothetical protein